MARSTSSTSRSGVSTNLLLSLALLAALGPLSIDMYLPGLTAMAGDLNTSASTIQLTLTSFLVGLAMGQVVIGALSDRFGRRQPLIISMAVCLIASIGCALAPSISILIALRFVQGFSGAAGVVIGRSIIRDQSHGPSSVKSFSKLAALSSIAPVLAPLLGGILLPLIHWRGVLAVIAFATLVMLINIYMFVPESLPRAHRSTGGVAGVFRSVKGLLANRVYVGFLLTLAFSFGAVFAYVSASPFVFQNVLGLSTRGFSAAFTFNACGLIIASAINTRITGRIDPARILTVAQLSLVSLSLLLAVTFLTGIDSIYTVLPLTFAFIMCIGFTVGNATALAMNAVSAAVGTAAALLGTFQYTFGAITSPLVGLGGEDNATMMVAVMLGCGTIGLIVLLLTRRAIARQGSASPEAAPAQPALAGKPH